MARPLTVTVPHTLGKAEAKQRLEAGFGDMQRQLAGASVGMLNMQERWEGERLYFEGGGLGQRISGRLDVRDESVYVEVDLPDMLAALARPLMARLKKESQRLLEQK